MFNTTINSAAKDAGGMLKIKVDGIIVKENIQLSTTQGSDKWQSITVEGMDLPLGELIVKFYIIKEGSSLLDFSFIGL